MRRGSLKDCCRSRREPIVRRLPGAGPACVGRGLQVRLAIDDTSFGGGGGILLAAVLDRFFAKYVSINAFTETVMSSPDRGEVMRWPLRVSAAGRCCSVVAPARPSKPRRRPHRPSGLPRGVASCERRTHSAFITLLRLFEARQATGPRLGRSLQPAQDAIRLGQEPSVTHAPASLAGYEPGEDGRPDRLLVHLFGLFGPDGPLPLHMTE